MPGPPIIDGDVRLPERARVGAVPDGAEEAVGEGPALDFGGPDEP